MVGGVQKANKSGMNLVRTNSKWLSPNGDTIKTNFDGAHDEGSDRAGQGIVARNAGGQVIFAGSKMQNKQNAWRPIRLMRLL